MPGLRQGVNLPFECATGTCGTCRARVMSGEVEVRWNEAPGAARLKPEKGDILMCQSWPRSDTAVRVPSDLVIDGYVQARVASRHHPQYPAD